MNENNFYKETRKPITKESTWEYDENDESVKAGGDLIVDTIETWVWDPEDGTYILDQVIEKDTGDEITLYETIRDTNPLV